MNATVPQKVQASQQSMPSPPSAIHNNSPSIRSRR